MSLFKLQENGFLMLKEDESYASPIATLFYEYYNSESKLISKLNSDMDQIQCVVGNIELKNTVSFGNTQSPRLSDYADGVDTLQFIIDL